MQVEGLIRNHIKDKVMNILTIDKSEMHFTQMKKPSCLGIKMKHSYDFQHGFPLKGIESQFFKLKYMKKSNIFQIE
jgi:hypothetical protein